MSLRSTQKHQSDLLPMAGDARAKAYRFWANYAQRCELWQETSPVRLMVLRGAKCFTKETMSVVCPLGRLTSSWRWLGSAWCSEEPPVGHSIFIPIDCSQEVLESYEHWHSLVYHFGRTLRQLPEWQRRLPATPELRWNVTIASDAKLTQQTLLMPANLSADLLYLFLEFGDIDTPATRLRHGMVVFDNVIHATLALCHDMMRLFSAEHDAQPRQELSADALIEAVRMLVDLLSILESRSGDTCQEKYQQSYNDVRWLVPLLCGELSARQWHDDGCARLGFALGWLSDWLVCRAEPYSFDSEPVEFSLYQRMDIRDGIKPLAPMVREAALLWLASEALANQKH